MDHLIRMEPGGKVVALRDGGATRIVLGNLGPLGTILFELPLAELLEIRLHAEVIDSGMRGRGSVYEVLVQLNPSGKT